MVEQERRLRLGERELAGSEVQDGPIARLGGAPERTVGIDGVRMADRLQQLDVGAGIGVRARMRELDVVLCRVRRTAAALAAPCRNDSMSPV